jgi:hypothetical protein
VAAPVEPVVVDEVVRVGALGPAAGAWYSSSGNTLMANATVMALAPKKPAVFSQYSRAAETPVLVGQYSVMLSSSRPG